MLLMASVVGLKVNAKSPLVTTRFDGNPNAVAFAANKKVSPRETAVAELPSGAMVSEPGPEALTVTDLPMSSLVAVTRSDPVVLIIVDPFGSAVTVEYSLSTGKSKCTGNAQKPDGKSKGCAAA